MIAGIVYDASATLTSKNYLASYILSIIVAFVLSWWLGKEMKKKYVLFSCVLANKVGKVLLLIKFRKNGTPSVSTSTFSGFMVTVAD